MMMLRLKPSVLLLTKTLFRSKAGSYFRTQEVIGVPPLSGFVSKWYLALGSVEAGELVFLAVLLISSVLNAAYFLPVTYVAFFGTEEPVDEPPEEPPESGRTIREIPLVTIPLVVTAALSLLMGIYPDYFLTLAEGVVR